MYRVALLFLVLLVLPGSPVWSQDAGGRALLEQLDKIDSAAARSEEHSREYETELEEARRARKVAEDEARKLREQLDAIPIQSDFGRVMGTIANTFFPGIGGWLIGEVNGHRRGKKKGLAGMASTAARAVGAMVRNDVESAPVERRPPPGHAYDREPARSNGNGRSGEYDALPATASQRAKAVQS